MRQTLKTPHYRIDDPSGKHAVRFISEAAPAGEAPKVTPQLAPIGEATTFSTWTQAATCFSKYLAGQTFDIVRIDA
jgi:hypothetical protein